MQHLATAWRIELIKQGLPEETARKAAFLDGMPQQMHEDIMNHGFWDETGERYTRLEMQNRPGGDSG